jgi:TonB-dependent SusC/RagA subfamily outer membrane receptor
MIKTMKMKIKILLILLFAAVTINYSLGQNNKRITITGVVVDLNQKPVRDAIILVDGKKTSSVTDKNGFYKVKVKPASQKIGLLTSLSGINEEEINGRININFTLSSDIPKLMNKPDFSEGEEEVNIGYGTMKRKNLTNQVDRIDGTNKKYSAYTSIYDMLRGEIPGVKVTGKSISIQGVSSFTLTDEPLFVVDGMVVSSIDDIQPVMVKSVEVLKGPAASIYGSRGANGVIMITLIGASNNK